MTVADVIRGRPLPVYYGTPPEQRLAIILWAQSYAARLDQQLAAYIKASAIVHRNPRDMR